MTFTSAVNAAEKHKKNKQMLKLVGEVYDSFAMGKVKAFVTLLNADSTVVDTVTCDTHDKEAWSN